ncbi:GNAT family N-acetyltransferase [Kibdelosporangium persicum]|uniref:N-acetyltransferase YhbS n=1 Tax=Kibdelosporangium persicum TaxID=2698649 RepID=A0ABX2F0G1_9PSEU|nr:GNAT family N-acetyltransferase [Kibdelosporangium persicum]NRN64713.1 putative N-acetyltransferase YhbS [Kibdelosporangium persicum]
MLIRAVADEDWDSIATLEAGAYQDLGLSEDLSVLKSRAQTAFVLELDGTTAGYVLALPWRPFHCPDLGRPEREIVASTNLHLHDMVVADEHRRRGLGRLLLSRLVRAAKDAGYGRISLVAIGGREKFWSANGFRPHPQITVPSCYGPGALYMSTAI